MDEQILELVDGIETIIANPFFGSVEEIQIQQDEIEENSAAIFSESLLTHEPTDQTQNDGYAKNEEKVVKNQLEEEIVVRAKRPANRRVTPNSLKSRSRNVSKSRNASKARNAQKSRSRSNARNRSKSRTASTKRKNSRGRN